MFVMDGDIRRLCKVRGLKAKDRRQVNRLMSHRLVFVPMYQPARKKPNKRREP